MTPHSHPSPPPQEPFIPLPNWLDLPADVSVSILRRLDVVDVLTSAQYVCSTWRRICRDPSMWRSIHFVWYAGYTKDLTKLYQLAVDLSSGGLVDVSFDILEADALLRYITDRSKRLRRIRIGLRNMICDSEVKYILEAEKIPLIEELDIPTIGFSSEDVATFGRLCPLLYSFKFEMLSADAAFAIAENMPGLRHLRISGTELRSDGLIAILDGCKHLESLDLSRCFCLNLDGALKKRCSEQIKDFHGFDKSIYNFFPKLFRITPEMTEEFAMLSNFLEISKRPERKALPNWLELPDDLSSSIIRRLDAVDILTSVQYVCPKWRRICRDPSMWRSIHCVHYSGWSTLTLSKLYQLAVDLSSGGLVDVHLNCFECQVLLPNIIDRSGHLRSLHIGYYAALSDDELIEAAGKFPVLEHLDISVHFSSKVVPAIGRLCPLLHSFGFCVCDDAALAIAQNMPCLRRLHDYGNMLTNVGLTAILDGCQHLVYLYLKNCSSLKLDDGLRKRCSEQIKEFHDPAEFSAILKYFDEMMMMGHISPDPELLAALESMPDDADYDLF